MIRMDLNQKKQKLDRFIASQGSMLVAFSGGVDSTLLAARAQALLSGRTRCILLESPVVPRSAVAQAHQIARDLDLAFEILSLPQMEHLEFRSNRPDRCYLCKKMSAVYLNRRAVELGFSCVADGMNISDLGEHRPGMVASTEEGILHPFIEAGITKEEIRTIAREYDIPVWQKPSAACLSSRIPYGEEITTEKLRMIEEAEAFLAREGFGQLRVRMHGTIARIEVLPGEMERLLALNFTVVPTFQGLGFSYVTLDLQGYRSGSLDEVL